MLVSVWLTVLRDWVLIIISVRKFEAYWMKHMGNETFLIACTYSGNMSVTVDYKANKKKLFFVWDQSGDTQIPLKSRKLHVFSLLKLFYDMRTCRCWNNGEEEIFLDPTCCALAFRLLRLNGYDVSSGCFNLLHVNRFEFLVKERWEVHQSVVFCRSI